MEIKNYLSYIKEKDEKAQVKKRVTKVIINPPLKEDKLDEISKALLGKYIKKAKNDIGNKAFAAGRSKAKNPDVSHITKRSKSINKAVDILTKESLDVMTDPYQALKNPNLTAQEKFKAYKAIQIRSYNESEELNEAAKNDPVKMKAEGEEWHKKNPAHHMNIVNAYLDSNDSEKHFGKDWYSDAHKLTKFLSKGSGHPIHTVAGVIANHSPQNGIYQNYHDAVRVLDAGKGLGGKSQGVMASENQAAKDDRMFKGEHYNDVLQGKKIKSFAHLLEHGHQTDPSNPKVVIDRHAHSVVSGARITDNAFSHAGMKRKGRYEELEHHYLSAAEHLRKHHGVNIEPEQLQATTWAWRQRKNQEDEASRGSNRTAGNSLKQEVNWNQFAKTRFKGKIPKVPGHGFQKVESPDSEVSDAVPRYTKTKEKIHQKKLYRDEGHPDTWTHEF